MAMSIKLPLSARNAHPRDQNIKFYARGHKYEIATDPSSKYTSVTTWNHSHFPKFDADAVIQNIMRSKGWGPGHKYWGLSPEQIKESWKNNGDAVSSAGTSLHERIEDFMNDTRLLFKYSHKELLEMSPPKKDTQEQEQEQEISEWTYFIRFVQDHLRLVPYRTEWMIYHEEAKLAGSIDMVYENPDGTLMIYDWKRAKEIVKSSDWPRYALNPLISHLEDTNFWHYSLQLNTYRRIIQEKYGKTVTKLCLVRLHPNASTYELIEVPLLDKEMDDLFEERVRQVFLKPLPQLQPQPKPITIVTPVLQTTTNTTNTTKTKSSSKSICLIPDSFGF